MADNTSIQWTDVTWNPTTGCDRVSPGCDNCYALTMAKRLKGMGSAKYQRDGDPRTSGPGFGLTVHPSAVNLPLKWRVPKMVFVNSMSDLFHARVPRSWTADIFAVMAAAPRHTFQVLTKRPNRALRMLNDPAFAEQVKDRAAGKGLLTWIWPLPHVWLGTSIESDDYMWRADDLRQTGAAIRFLSLEPLLGPLSSLDLTGIHWVIVGGESGSGARPCELGWIEDIVNQCHEAEVPVFVKQFGSVLGRQFGAGPKGGDMERWPAYLQHRHFPRPKPSIPAA